MSWTIEQKMDDLQEAAIDAMLDILDSYASTNEEKIRAACLVLGLLI